MTQADFTKLVAADANKKLEADGKGKIATDTVKEVINSFVDVTKAQVAKGEKVSIAGFGTFEVSHRDARDGRNPITGETIHIAAKDVPKFKAAKAFKDILA